MTADKILPLVAELSPDERARLLRLIAAAQRDPGAAYSVFPVASEEFSSDEERLARDAGGWEEFY